MGGGGKDLNRERLQKIFGRKREKVSGGGTQQGKGGKDLREKNSGWKKALGGKGGKGSQ